MAIDLFCYGSLMFDPVWTRVVQGGYPAQPARLRGWRRGAVIGEDYPGALEVLSVPTALATVLADPPVLDGVLYREISNDDLVRLDAFEGDDYDRVTVHVELADGSVRPACIYRYRWPARLTAHDWSVDDFIRHRLPRFLAANGLAAGSAAGSAA